VQQERSDSARYVGPAQVYHALGRPGRVGCGPRSGNLTCACATTPPAWPSDCAEHVSLINIEDSGDSLILTFSGPLTGGPACAAKHSNVQVIDKDSPWAQSVRIMLKTGRPLKVRGSGNCEAHNGYETLEGVEIYPGTHFLRARAHTPEPSPRLRMPATFRSLRGLVAGGT
jgi:hypothetical protein